MMDLSEISEDNIESMRQVNMNFKGARSQPTTPTVT